MGLKKILFCIEDYKVKNRTDFAKKPFDSSLSLLPCRISAHPRAQRKSKRPWALIKAFTVSALTNAPFINFCRHAGNSLRICYGCDHILEIETLNRLLWFWFETWLRFRVAIRIATLIATLVTTLVKTSVPECFRGFESKSQPWLHSWSKYLFQNISGLRSGLRSWM